MPAGNMQLAIQITAEGRVDQVVRSINEQLKPLGQSLTPVSRQFKDNERQLGQSKQHLHEMRDSVTDIARKFTEIAPPLAMLGGLGSVAGIGEMLDHTSRLGRELAITSTNLGLTTQELQGVRGGAELTGVSIQATTGALGGLQAKLYGAAWGRDAQAIAVFRQFGIAARDTNGQIRSVRDVLPEVAAAVAKQKDPYVQAAIATAMLGDQGAALLPYLRRGRDGIAELNREMARYGGETSPLAIEASNMLREAQTRLEFAVHGVADTLLETWGPSVAGAMTKGAEWLAQLRQSPEQMKLVELGAEALATVFGITMVAALGKLLLAMNGVWAAPLIRFLMTPVGAALAGGGLLTYGAIKGQEKQQREQGISVNPVTGQVIELPGEEAAAARARKAPASQHGAGQLGEWFGGTWLGRQLWGAPSETPAAPPGLSPPQIPAAPAPGAAVTSGNRRGILGALNPISGAQAAPMPGFGTAANWQGPAQSARAEAPNDQRNNWASMRARGGGWQSFETPEAGVRATRDQLGRYASGATTGHKLDTLQDIIGTWAPPGENQTETLIARAERQLAIGRAQHMNMGDPETMRRLVSVMIANEHGGVLPKGAPQGMIDKALGFGGAASGLEPGGGAAPRAPGRFGGMAGGASEKGVDEMIGMRGLDRGRDRGRLNSYLQSAGEHLDVGVSAWCAAFVNASLERQGIKGDRSDIATDFARWGQGVAAEQAQKGDVLVKMRGHRPGEIGGHVGRATGRVSPEGLIEMVQGNKGGQVATSWERPGELTARRAVPDAVGSTIASRYRPEITVPSAITPAPIAPAPVEQRGAEAAPAPEIDTSGIAAAAQSRHQVEISFLNAPAGMRSGLRAASGPADLELRTQFAMTGGL